MLNRRIANRFSAVAVALAITLLANYAISFAARSGQANPGTTPKPRIETVERSGQVNPGTTPKPATSRSGQANPGTTPKP
jgi:hypothetical protein